MVMILTARTGSAGGSDRAQAARRDAIAAAATHEGTRCRVRTFIAGRSVDSGGRKNRQVVLAGS
jgi:hypothetical protein